MPIAVTVLVENTCAREDLVPAHGLAFWIEADGVRILFDTAPGEMLIHNARALGVPLEEVDAIVLSHGHYDHTGGLPFALLAAMPKAIYLHPDALVPRFKRLDAPPHKPIGMPEASKEALLECADRLQWTQAPARVADRVWCTGAVPRRTAYEDVGGPFFVDAACTRADILADDQAVWFDTSEGTVVLLGCAHSGVVNTLDYVAELAGTTRFHAVIGGTHLMEAGQDRLLATAGALGAYHIRQLAPCHCTGNAAMAFLHNRFPESCVSCSAGNQFLFD